MHQIQTMFLFKAVKRCRLALGPVRNRPTTAVFSWCLAVPPARGGTTRAARPRTRAVSVAVPEADLQRGPLDVTIN